MPLENGQPTDDEILAGHQSGSPAGSEPPAGAPPAEPSFNPADWAYKFRNETVQPKDRAEMIELLQLGASYRVNKPTWEKERETLRAYETRKDVYQRYDQLAEAMAQNPEFRTELETLAQKYSGQPTQVPAQPNAGGIPPEVEKELKEFREWKTSLEAREADKELQNELDTLEKSKPGYDWKSDHGEGTLRQQLLKYMAENSIYDAEKAFKAMMYDSDVKRVEFDAKKKTEEEAARLRKLGVTASGTQGPPAPKDDFDPRKYSYDQLEQMELERLSRR